MTVLPGQRAALLASARMLFSHSALTASATSTRRNALLRTTALAGTLFVAMPVVTVLVSGAMTPAYAGGAGGTGGGNAGTGGGGALIGAGGNGAGGSAAGGASSQTGAGAAGQDAGGTNGGGGGGAGDNPIWSGGGGGGVGGGLSGHGTGVRSSTLSAGYVGGDGGFGGGGGGAEDGLGGNGGFGGGGGSTGGAGGFGGGGGGGLSYDVDNIPGGAGGFGAGSGGLTAFDSFGDLDSAGGGGLGAGGGIFVQQGGSITIAGGSISGGSVAGGAGGDGSTSGPLAGTGFGTGIFIQGSQTIDFAPAAGETLTIGDVIADQTGSGGVGNNAGAGGILISGGGSVALTAANTYTGGTEVSGSGTVLALSADNNLGSGALKLDNGTTIAFTGSFTLNHAIGVSGDPIFNVGVGNTVTQSGTISDSGGPGDVEVTGGGTLVLNVQNHYSGGSLIIGSTLELAASGGAGSGAIAFNTGTNDTLRIDGAAFSGTSFGNSITNFAAGDIIDLRDIAYNSSDTVSYSSGMLTVKDAGGGTLASLSLGVANGSSAGDLVAASDQHSGTAGLEIQLLASVTSVTAEATNGASDLDAGKVVTLTVNFSSPVSVTGTPELQLNDSEFATYTGGTGTTALTFSYTVQPTDNTADLKVQSLLLNGGTIEDGTGNAAVLTNAATDLHLQVDTTAPTVTISADSTALLAGQTTTVTFTFSESVPGFVLGDTSATGGTLSDLAHAGLVAGQDIYTATFTPSASNTEVGSVQVNALSFSDGAGNAGAASNGLSFTGDTLAPTVTVSANGTTLLAGQTSTVTFTFSEAVQNFVLGDTSVTGGALSHLVHTGLVAGQDIYTATFTPNVADTEVGSVQVNALSYDDLAGNAGAASNSLSFSGDTLAPTATVSATSTALLAGQTSTVTFTFSEAIENFVLGDTTVTGGALSDLTHNGLVAGQDIYTATFTPDATNTEVGSVQVTASSYRDLAGNAGAASNDLGFGGDTQAPTVTVSANSTTLLAGQTATVTFTFSEAIQNFVLGDTSVTGGALSDLVHTGPVAGQDIYTATFTPDVTNTETGAIQVNASSYSDLAGNAGAASNSIGFSGDTLAPTVSIAADHTALLAGLTALVTFAFSEPLAAFTLADATVTGGALSDLTHTGLVAGQDIYTAVFTPDASNTETGSVQLTASSYTDVAGNAGSASNAVNFAGDTLAPTATRVTATTDSGHGDINAGHVVTITLDTSEPVTVTGSPELQLNNGEFATYTGSTASALTFTYTVQPHDNSPDLHVESLLLNGGTVNDLAGNPFAPVAADLGIQIDTTAPLLTGIATSPGSGSAFAGSTVQFVFAFDEAVNVSGGTPELTLNDGGTAVYDAAATALLGDASRLVFDHLVTADAPPTPALAVTGFVSHGATVDDLAGNPADLTHVAAAFSALAVNESFVPSYTINGFTRPELELDASGHIILDQAAANAAASYGLKFLYVGLPASTPYPPVAEIHHDFQLV
jgi:Bacterial Ig-like domain